MEKRDLVQRDKNYGTVDIIQVKSANKNLNAALAVV